MIKNKIKKHFSKYLKKRGYALINLSNTFTTRKEFIYILLFAYSYLGFKWTILLFKNEKTKAQGIIHKLISLSKIDTKGKILSLHNPIDKYPKTKLPPVNKWLVWLKLLQFKHLRIHSS